MVVAKWLSRSARSLMLAGFAALLAGAPVHAADEAVQAAPAVRIDPVAGVLDAFRTHDVVALGEGNHGNEQGHRYRLSLIRDPRFAATVNDIVVESGNARYQPIMDRFIAGEDVPYGELRKSWENTTQSGPIWDVPIYEEFFRAVRDVNRSLPPGRRLRVILGDTPIDWDQIRSEADYRRQPQRDDAFVAGLIQTEVIAKHRKALIVYGNMHLLRRDLAAAVPEGLAAADVQYPDQRDTIVQHLERAGVKVFSVWTTAGEDLASVQPDIAQWSAPSLALAPGTSLGRASFSLYYPHSLGRFRQPDGSSRLLYVSPSIRLEEEFDAVLYLGRRNQISYSMPDRRLCGDPAYLQMRTARMEMFGAKDMVEMGRQHCAKVMGNQ